MKTHRIYAMLGDVFVITMHSYFFDPGSTHNFISVDVAMRMGITTEELGPALDAQGAFKGQEVPVTPLGKLRLHVQDYSDGEAFFVSPLVHKDVILGTPWFHKNYENLEFPSRTIILKTRDRQIKIRTEAKGNTIPIVSSDAIQKVIKKSLFAYMVCIQPLSPIFVSTDVQINHATMQSSSNNSNMETQVNKDNYEEFLKQYHDCFSESLPDELPPMRGEDDHKINLIPGGAPTNIPPYRVSRAQQEEIMSQVQELLEKGLIRPSSSPFCSPV